jgi:hypothetical protein
MKLLAKYFPKTEEEYVRFGDVPFNKTSTAIEVPISDTMQSVIQALGLKHSDAREGKWIVYSEKPEFIEYVKKKVLELKNLEQDRDKLYIVKLELQGGAQSRLIRYGRDHADFENNVLFKPLVMLRARSPQLRGSTKYPKFYGILIISSRLRPDIICNNVKEYVELPDTPEVREEVSTIINEYRHKLSEAGDADVFIKVWDELKSKLEELKMVYESVKEEAVEAEAVKAEEEEPTPIAIPEVEIKPKELEVEFEAQPTAVMPAPEVRKPELVKIYLLSMKLPSKYLVQKVEVREGEEVRKWEGISAEIASRLEGIRRKAYDMISKIFANVEDYGVWVAVTEEAVKEAQKISEWVRKELSALPITQVKDVDVDKLITLR